MLDGCHAVGDVIVNAAKVPPATVHAKYTVVKQQSWNPVERLVKEP